MKNKKPLTADELATRRSRRTKRIIAAISISGALTLAGAKTHSITHDIKVASVSTQGSTLVDKKGIPLKELNEGDIVLYANQIGNSRTKQVITLDNNGDEITGYIMSDAIEKLGKIPYNSLEEKNGIYRVNKKSNLYKATDKSKVKKEIPGGSYVFASDNIDKDNLDNGVVDVMYLTQHKLSHGYIDYDQIEYIGDLNEDFSLKTLIRGKIKRQMVTTADKNLLNNPRLEDTKVVHAIPKDAVVEILDEQTTNASGLEWYKVKYKSEDEGSFSGWIEKEYLEEMNKVRDIEEEKERELGSKYGEVLNNTYINKDNNVIGIDISGLSPEKLHKLLTDDNFIPESTSRLVSGEDTYMDTSNLGGKVNFVYIKIGGTGYGEEFSQFSSDQYKEQAKVCEELGVPYGFYYFSTAINEEEGKKEADFYSQLIEDYKDECLDGKDLHILPLAIDVELTAGEDDRQYGKDLTAAKAVIYNSLKEKYGKPIMYISGSLAARNTPEEYRLLDINKFSNLVGEEVEVWLPEYRLNSGKMSDASKDQFENINEEDVAIVKMHQSVLDATVNDCNIDINEINADYYKEWLKRTYSTKKIKSAEEQETSKDNDNSFKKFWNDFIKDIDNNDEGR